MYIVGILLIQHMVRGILGGVTYIRCDLCSVFILTFEGWITLQHIITFDNEYHIRN